MDILLNENEYNLDIVFKRKKLSNSVTMYLQLANR